MLLALFLFVSSALAGPPLICHSFDIGNAKSIPWASHDWNLTGSENYNTKNLATETIAILDSDSIVLVHMETLRRATLYARRDPVAAKELITKLVVRADSSANSSAAVMTTFDLGYLVECYKQWMGKDEPKSSPGTRRLWAGQESHAASRQRPANGFRRCAYHAERPGERASGLRTKNACWREDGRIALAQPFHALHGRGIGDHGGNDLAHTKREGSKAMKSGITGAVAMRLPSLFMRPFVGAAVLLTFLALPRTHFAKQSFSPTELTVHEWGTFTSISGKDGHAIYWLPLTGSTDLPSFVEHLREPNFKGGLRGTIRMETPVIYFVICDQTPQYLSMFRSRKASSPSGTRTLNPPQPSSLAKTFASILCRDRAPSHGALSG